MEKAALERALPVELVEVRAGRSLAVHLAGAGDHVVVFVHGSAASLLQWSAQLAEVSQSCRTVAYDWYGCGRSPKPRDWYAYSAREHFLDLRAVVARYGASTAGRTTLVCHSAGCSMALRLAAEHVFFTECGAVTPSSPLDSLVLLSPPASLPSRLSPSLGLFYLPTAVLDRLQPTLTASFSALALHPATLEGRTEEHRALCELTTQASNANPMHMCRAYYRQLSLPSASAVGAVACPVLLACGEHDLITPAETHADALRALLTSAETPEVERVRHASHQLMQEQPAAVNELLRHWLEERGRTHQHHDLVGCAVEATATLQREEG